MSGNNLSIEAVREWLKKDCGWDIVRYQCTISGKDVYIAEDSSDYKGCIVPPCIGNTIYIIVDGDAIHQASLDEADRIMDYMSRPNTIKELEDVIAHDSRPQWVERARKWLKEVLSRPIPTL